MSFETTLPRRYAAITPSDTTIQNYLVGLFVGTGGDVSVTGDDGVSVILKAVSGSFIQARFYTIRATGTTATNLVACYSQ